MNLENLKVLLETISEDFETFEKTSAKNCRVMHELLKKAVQNGGKLVLEESKNTKVCTCGTEEYVLPEPVNNLFICGKCGNPY